MPSGYVFEIIRPMQRLKLLFALVLLLLALPFWRFIDILVVASPFNFPIYVALIFWFGIFVLIPTKLMVQKVKTWMVIFALGAFTAMTFLISPFSNMATRNPEFNHCGHMTFTGTFYPVRKILTNAYLDDLEARNQQCWIRKMINKVPEKFEMVTYSKITHEKLLKPEIKFRSSLPLVAALFFKINVTNDEAYAAKNIYDSIHFWIEHYTEEISQRKYPAWNWPHSSYIQFEYGLIEKNWQSFIDSLVIN